MLVGYFTGQSGNFAIENGTHTQFFFFFFFLKNRIILRKIVLSYLLLKIRRNTTKSYWLAGLPMTIKEFSSRRFEKNLIYLTYWAGDMWISLRNFGDQVSLPAFITAQVVAWL